jgi:hypothetical protein
LDQLSALSLRADGYTSGKMGHLLSDVYTCSTYCRHRNQQGFEKDRKIMIEIALPSDAKSVCQSASKGSFTKVMCVWHFCVAMQFQQKILVTAASNSKFEKIGYCLLKLHRSTKT